MADEPPPPRRRARRVRTYGLPAADRSALGRLLIEGRREEEERRRVLDAAIAWVQEKWGSRACPYCGEIRWEVGTPLEIQLFPDEVMSPSFPVMCGNCGHTTLVNAILAGLVLEEE